MAKLIFLTGGARSGKSSYALELAKQHGKRVTFIATCVPLDKEMKKRVALHKKARPSSWRTIEEPYKLIEALKKNSPKTDVYIIDCLTLWLSNMMLSGNTEKSIKNYIRKFTNFKQNFKPAIILISNEVGSGIVPENKLARDFRDLAGSINQAIARHSDEAYAMISGYPIRLK
ncbi:MAG: bifunctional adenosylcobinamide kinase/adenosylcobinamide-phosphate guanylyltransferase [Elusimicrobia bacterium RIFOXYB2_FULL_49_7]|nr:MAG: bifunctional adenosylcobinamide kinase/adenosylcobinamide-phosphate guanylyltransferase [Elusimicrobia bacterium RIFOXYB2_FULL_49_7]